MTMFVYLCDKEDLTKPVYVSSFYTDNEGEALERAKKNPAVKKFFGKQQTGRLILKCFREKISYEASPA